MSRGWLIGLVLAAPQLASTQEKPTRDLALAPEHIHWGYYDARVPPVLRIASGDRVRMVVAGLPRIGDARTLE